MTQQLHVWAYSQNNGKQGLGGMPAPPRSQRHHSQQPRWEGTQVSIDGVSLQTQCVPPDNGGLFSLKKGIPSLVTPSGSAGHC